MRVLNIMGSVSKNAPEQTARKINQYFQNHKITVGVFQSENDEFERECAKRGINVLFYDGSLTYRLDPISPLPSKGAFKSVFDALLSESEYDLIHVYGGPVINGPIGKVYSLKERSPLIVRFNGYVPLPETQPKRILAKSIVDLLTDSTKVVFNSREQKKDILSTYGVEEDENIKVIPPGIDTQYFQPSSSTEQLRNELNISSSTNIIGSVITPRPIKRLDRAFDIVKDVSKDMKIKYIILGESRFVDEYKELAETKGVSDLVYWAGHQDQSELSMWYSLFDITIMTSDWESFGMSITESYLCETPCIAFDVGGMSDQIQNKKTGFLIEPYDLEKFSNSTSGLLNKPKKRKEFGLNGKEYVFDRFSLKSAAEQYSSMLSEIQ